MKPTMLGTFNLLWKTSKIKNCLSRFLRQITWLSGSQEREEDAKVSPWPAIATKKKPKKLAVKWAPISHPKMKMSTSDCHRNVTTMRNFAIMDTFSFLPPLQSQMKTSKYPNFLMITQSRPAAAASNWMKNKTICPCPSSKINSRRASTIRSNLRSHSLRFNLKSNSGASSL